MEAPDNLKTHQDFRNHYLEEGYVSLGVSTHTGAEILRHERLGRVVKLTIAGKDPAVEFARLAQAATQPGFPKVMAIHEGRSIRSGSGSDWRPCAIVMEELHPLTERERRDYENWVRNYLQWRNDGGDKPEDTLGLEPAVDALISEAVQLGGSVRLTLLHSKNVLARKDGDRRELVVIDPWY